MASWRSRFWSAGWLLGVLALHMVASGAATGPLVQRGTAVIPNGSSSVSVSLSTIVDKTRSFLLFSSVSTSSSPADALVRGDLSSAGNQVTFNRSASTATSDTISYQVVAHPDISVQHVSATLAGGVATATAAITSVPSANSFQPGEIGIETSFRTNCCDGSSGRNEGAFTNREGTGILPGNGSEDHTVYRRGCRGGHSWDCGGCSTLGQEGRGRSTHSTSGCRSPPY